MKKKPAAGDSAEQRAIEPILLASLGRRLGVSWSEDFEFPGGNRLQVDGVCTKSRVLCEVYAHQGEMKPGQKRKVVTDAFKLLYAEKLLGRTARKVLAFADSDAAEYFLRDTWPAAAFRELGIDVEVVPLTGAQRARLRKAQIRQVR